MSAIQTISRPTTRNRMTVAEFEKLIARGVFHPDSRLELIHGEIIPMSPIDKDHAYVVDDLTEHFSELYPRMRLSVQGPMRLSHVSRPQPDLMLLKRRSDRYRTRLPDPADILLAIEVADSSFRIDYNIKRPAYATEGIRELWIVEIPKKRIHICRRPKDGAYLDESIVKGSDKIAPLAFPDHLLTVRDLLG